MERTWRQITAKRAVNGSNFDKGIIDFDFSIGGRSVWVPSRSYFRIGVRLTEEGKAPARAGDVAFANFCPGNLFDNCYALAGGQNLSSIVNYAPQAHACSYRLKKSGAWLSTIGKDAYGIQSNWSARHEKCASDGTLGGEAHTFPVDQHDQSVVYFMYQPPIGIMDHNKPLGSGDYRFQFNPNANYKTACVESLAASLAVGTAGGEFDFQVDSMELYICTEKMDVSPTGTDTLHLMEHQVQSKPISAAGEQNFDFTVPPSTKAISIFVQSSRAGTNTLVPPSSFKCIADDGKSPGGAAANRQNTLRSIQLTYANMTKPPTRWSSSIGPNTQKLQQRYLDTQIESSQAFSSGGCETMAQWLESGLLLHFNWNRDASDRSTQLQLQADFEAIEPNTNLFVVAHYSRTAQISVSNGFVSSVSTLSV